MALLGFLGVSEGLEVLLILLALIIVSLFLIRYLSFYLRFRRIKRENMELASHMKKKLKSARFRSSSDFDEEEDEMFGGPAVKAKVPVIPASYEARLAKTERKAARRRARKARARKPARTRRIRKVR